jgi:hypothetical protein
MTAMGLKRRSRQVRANVRSIPDSRRGYSLRATFCSALPCLVLCRAVQVPVGAVVNLWSNFCFWLSHRPNY